jgi:hypothetical protein
MGSALPLRPAECRTRAARQLQILFNLNKILLNKILLNKILLGAPMVSGDG